MQLGTSGLVYLALLGVSKILVARRDMTILRISKRTIPPAVIERVAMRPVSLRKTNSKKLRINGIAKTTTMMPIIVRRRERRRRFNGFEIQ